jgi:hypothetical protein
MSRRIAALPLSVAAERIPADQVTPNEIGMEAMPGTIVVDD